MKISGFEKLEVWHDAKNLAVLVYQMTDSLPNTEKFGLVNQIRRAIISVSSNIAEGSTRSTKKDQAHFYTMAYSSMIEVLSQLLISYELGYVSKPKLVEVRQEIEKVTNKLNALRNSLNL